MDRFEIRPNFDAGIRRQPQYRTAMREKTAIARQAVLAVAPEHTGYYRRKLQQHGTTVVAADSFWHLVEYGSANNPAYGPLRRGLMAAGFNFVPTPK